MESDRAGWRRRGNGGEEVVAVGRRSIERIGNGVGGYTVMHVLHFGSSARLVDLRRSVFFSAEIEDDLENDRSVGK